MCCDHNVLALILNMIVLVLSMTAIDDYLNMKEMSRQEVKLKHEKSEHGRLLQKRY